MKTTKLALALTAVVALAGACGDDDDTDDAVVTTTTTSTTTTEAPSTTSTTATPTPRLVDPAETARAWIAEVGGGDDADAIALTAPRSLAAVGGEQGFREREIELAEGWGAWDFAENLEVTTVEIDAETALVVLHGNVAQEGPPEESWAALPVVATDDGDRVEPFLDLGAVEVDPPAGSAIDAQPAFTVDAPAGVRVSVAIDDHPAAPIVVETEGDRASGRVASSITLEPGLHSFTVVLTGADGVMARTFLYTVPMP